MNDTLCQESNSTTPPGSPPRTDDNDVLFGDFIENEAITLNVGEVESQVNAFKQSILTHVRNGHKSIKAYHMNKQVIERLRNEGLDIERRYCRCLGKCKHSQIYYKIYFVKSKLKKKRKKKH